MIVNLIFQNTFKHRWGGSSVDIKNITLTPAVKHVDDLSFYF